MTSVYFLKITDKLIFLKKHYGYIYLYLQIKWFRKHSLTLQPAGIIQQMSILANFFVLQNKVATSKQPAVTGPLPIPAPPNSRH